MRVLAFANSKGGISKTSLSTNLSYYLSSIGHKVLLVDTDYQGNAWASFFKEDPEHELADVLTERCTFVDAITEVRPNFDMIGSKRGSKALREYQSGAIQQEPMVFYNFVDILKEHFDYDFVIYDSHPALGVFEKSVLASCDEVIVPLQPEAFGVDGVGIFNDGLAEIRKGLRSNVKHNKIVITMIDSRLKIHEKYINDLKQYDQYQFFEINTCVDFKKSQDQFQSIFEFETDKKLSGTRIKAENAIKALAEVI